ncbi:DUF3558 domain-containing protein [Actinomyces slackii]|uniref:Uncharacterized protein n=1 Tax=Actinomyces slackii TaxID=52774 RepID=A0A448KAF1_9ACTO|nr:Uncharacterised protein [Actinomyces slackii]
MKLISFFSKFDDCFTGREPVWRAGLIAGVLICLSISSCAAVSPNSTASNSSPTPLEGNNLCDVVSSETVMNALKFPVHRYGYAHWGNSGSSDRWLCNLTSLNDRGLDEGRISIEYTANDTWKTIAGRVWSPLNTSAPGDETLKVESVALPGHEGQGWIIGRAEKAEDYGTFVWHYPSGYYLVIWVAYGDIPAPASTSQGLQDLAVTIVDKIPPIAAGPDIPYTVYPENKTTAAVDN